MIPPNTTPKVRSLKCSERLALWIREHSLKLFDGIERLKFVNDGRWVAGLLKNRKRFIQNIADLSGICFIKLFDESASDGL